MGTTKYETNKVRVEITSLPTVKQRSAFIGLIPRSDAVPSMTTIDIQYGMVDIGEEGDLLGVTIWWREDDKESSLMTEIRNVITEYADEMGDDTEDGWNSEGIEQLAHRVWAAVMGKIDG